MLNLQVRGDAQPVAEQISVASGVRLGRVVYSILPRTLVDSEPSSGSCCCSACQACCCVSTICSAISIVAPPTAADTPDHSHAFCHCSTMDAARCMPPTELAIRAARGHCYSIPE